MQQQGLVLISVTHITSKIHGDIPGPDSNLNHMDVQELSPLTCGITQVGLVTGSIVELALIVGP